MSNQARGVRGVRAVTRDPAASHGGNGGTRTSTTFGAVRKSEARTPVVSLTFRDRLRIEYDGYFRDLFLRISARFEKLPNAAWNGLRRNPLRSEHPWGRFLVLIDDAAREDTSDDELLEIPALLTAYIHARRAQLELTPAEGVMTIPEHERRIA
jgi:hypothetical protein